MTALKILFVIDSLGEGGSERSLAELLPFLEDSEIQPIIVCLTQVKQGVQKDVQDGGFDLRFLQGGFVSSILQLRNLIQNERPNLIHTTLFASNVRARFASVGTRAPVITSLVNVPYTHFRFQDPRIKPQKLRIVQMIDSWTSRFLTNHFHAVSDSVKQAAVNDLKIQPERITVIERGRDSFRLGKPTRERRLLCRLRLGLHEEQKVLVTVGRQDYQKGQCYLLEAMSRLMPNYPDLILLLVGHRGAVSTDLENLCETAKLNGAVRSLGYRHDVPDILAAADIFVFPSLYEGLPGAVIEAMALGLPIVGSDIPSMREVVEPGKNALLIRPKSSAELAESIHALLMDPQKIREMGIRSREIFEARFTMEISASRMIELFHSVAAAG